MVCLNLPPHLRYLPENIYVAGVIPGPSKPSTVQINHFIALIIDELLEFWDPGVSYTQTAKAPYGRLVRLVVIPLVCDLPAARQVAGLGNFNQLHALCSCCTVRFDDIENTDVDSFPLRSMKAHREAATAWLHANSTAEREQLFKTTGIRYTELLRLPYWNPVLYVVIDSMHNLYLGILQRHIRDFWGINAPPRPSVQVMNVGVDHLLYGSNSDLRSDGKAVLFHLCLDRGIRRAGTVSLLMKNLKQWRQKENLPKPRPAALAPVSPEPPVDSTQSDDRFAHINPADYDAAEKLLRTTKSYSYFTKKTVKDILAKMCYVRGLSSSGTKDMMAQRLWAEDVSVEFPDVAHADDSYDIQRGESPPVLFEPKGSKSSQQKGTVPIILGPPALPGTAALGRETMREYVKDRTRIELPRWVNAAPVAFGTQKHGKLSADQWRTVAVVHLPVTLIRTWGIESGRRLQMLQNFIDIVDAVETFGLLEIDEDEISHAHKQLVKYLEGVKELYKGAKFQVTHHHALHLALFIRLFGPVHSWRAFAFERMNFLLQSVNTNLKFGDLEMTMMMSSCRNANLRPLLDAPPVRSAMPVFVHELERLSTEDRRGMRLDEARRLLHDVAPPKTQHGKGKTITLDDLTFRALLHKLNHEPGSMRYIAESNESDSDSPTLSREARETSKLDISGVFYRPWRTAPGDSNVIFRRPEDGRHCAGRIERIFQHCRKIGNGSTAQESFIVVKELVELKVEDVVHDPYRCFGRVGGWLCYAMYRPEELLLRPDEVLCHFAKTMLGELRIEGQWLCEREGRKWMEKGQEYVHVRPLDRVRESAKLFELRQSAY
ncbi:hypothetical protein PYCCODRAFT_1371822 [Trametes coccinea BRFM310]|uniref:SAP domain-containing protein n=1 Tax=Trametes coccinea (strain BRFM310) TaxID=1353009 RepID=A0A1Y2IGD9_TRAC3|nr:hypothetical protein PYCCODRAFT_1371822 [Trametes coccinea BRFM310]